VLNDRYADFVFCLKATGEMPASLCCQFLADRSRLERSRVSQIRALDGLMSEAISFRASIISDYPCIYFVPTITRYLDIEIADNREKRIARRCQRVLILLGLIARVNNSKNESNVFLLVTSRYYSLKSHRLFWMTDRRLSPNDADDARDNFDDIETTSRFAIRCSSLVSKCTKGRARIA